MGAEGGGLGETALVLSAPIHSRRRDSPDRWLSRASPTDSRDAWRSPRLVSCGGARGAVGLALSGVAKGLPLCG